MAAVATEGGGELARDREGMDERAVGRERRGRRMGEGGQGEGMKACLSPRCRWASCCRRFDGARAVSMARPTTRRREKEDGRSGPAGLG
jgi:hypothetical protein